MSLSAFFVSKDAKTGSEHKVAELSRWENLGAPVLETANWDVESWGDDTALVKSAQKLNDDLSRSVVVDILEFTDVT